MPHDSSAPHLVAFGFDPDRMTFHHGRDNGGSGTGGIMLTRIPCPHLCCEQNSNINLQRRRIHFGWPRPPNRS
jgi:hypothetical protein